MIKTEINNILTVSMRPEEHNLFNLVRREILASEDILEMLPIKLRHQVKIVQEEINKME